MYFWCDVRTRQVLPYSSLDAPSQSLGGESKILPGLNTLAPGNWALFRAIVYLIIRYGSLSQEKKNVYFSFYSPFERKNCRRRDSRQHLLRLFE